MKIATVIAKLDEIFSLVSKTNSKINKIVRKLQKTKQLSIIEVKNAPSRLAFGGSISAPFEKTK